jgi:hypothetical protein
MRLSVKERRIKLANATNLNGKSGVAELGDLQFGLEPNHAREVW